MASEEYPFILKDMEERIISVEYTNRKGYKKSLETGRIWVFHSGTGRLLPYTGPGENAEILALSEGENWREAKLAFQLTNPAEPSVPAEKPLFKPTKSSKPVSVRQKLGMPEENIIGSLAELIKERHLQLPKGSYTTHLFESGAEKIRKKAGEEAIELILAQDREQIVYEAADLVYHMLVLLESEEIEWQEILEELRKR